MIPLIKVGDAVLIGKGFGVVVRVSPGRAVVQFQSGALLSFHPMAVHLGRLAAQEYEIHKGGES
jgi:hypothetical protein